MRIFLLFALLTVLPGWVMAQPDLVFSGSPQQDTLYVAPTATDGNPWILAGPVSGGEISSPHLCVAGEKRHQDMGRIDVISPHPCRYGEWVVGSVNGGMFKTRDGGRNWESVTDVSGLSFVGISAIQRHPKNPDILYAATRKIFGIWYHGGATYCGDQRSSYGIGLLVSTDGGDHWQCIGANQLPPISRQDTYRDFFNSGCLAVDPRSTLRKTRLAIGFETRIDCWQGSADMHDGEWSTPVSFDDWENGDDENHWHNMQIDDVAFTARGSLWFSRFDGLWEYDFSSREKRIIPLPWPDDVAADSLQYKGKTYRQNPLRWHIRLHPGAKDRWLLVAEISWLAEKQGKLNEKKKGVFFYYTKGTNSIFYGPKYVADGQVLSGRIADKPWAFFFQRGICVARADYDEQADSLQIQSTDNAANHVDARGFASYIDPCTKQAVHFLGTDGGVSISTDGQQWRDATGSGLTCTNFYGCAPHPDDTARVLCGAHDGSLNYFRQGQWLLTQPGGDNADAAWVPGSRDSAYQTSQGKIYLTAQQPDGDFRVIRSTGNGNWFFFPVWVSSAFPAGEVFWGGQGLGFSADYLRSVKDLSRRTIHQRATVYAIGSSAADPNRLYYATHGWYRDAAKPARAAENEGGVYCLRRGADGQWTADSLTDCSSNLRRYIPYGVSDTTPGLAAPITDLVVDPQDARHLWVSFGGLRDEWKVWESKDGGNSWQNGGKTGLPNLPVTAIAYDTRTQTLFAGTDVGVWFTRPDMDRWYRWGKGQPPATVTDLEIQEKEHTLYVTFMGRGLWKRKISPR